MRIQQMQMAARHETPPLTPTIYALEIGATDVGGVSGWWKGLVTAYTLILHPGSFHFRSGIGVRSVQRQNLGKGCGDQK